MTRQRKLISAAIAAAMAMPLTATLAEQPQAQGAKPAAGAQQTHSAVLASDLIGMKVVNPSGQDLGEVQDLVIDIRRGRVHYAMLDMQNKMFAYPMRDLRVSAGGDRLLLDMTEDRLERAPGMSRSHWDRRGGIVDDMTFGAYWREVDQYWRTVERDAASQTKPRAHLVWGSKLVGWNVHAQGNNDSIGEIKDVVIDPRNGAVKFAAVDFNRNIGGADASLLDDRLQPLPLDAFATREGGDDLVMTLDRARLKADQGFDEDRLDDLLADRAFIDKASRHADGLTPSSAATARR